jgi:hypothetical protein
MAEFNSGKDWATLEGLFLSLLPDAASEHPGRLDLFRRVLIASAPGFYFGGVKRAPRGNSMGQMGQRVRHG